MELKSISLGEAMNKTKVLIVEDETIVALDIKSAIKKLGYEVTSLVTNYDDALKSVKSNQPDVILMDIHLENSKDGIQTAIDIQKLKNIPIIYLTAFSDDTTIQRAVQTNPIGYLTKPFKREELKTTISLGLYKLNQNNHNDIDTSCYKLGFNYYYNLDKEQLFYENIPIKLSVKENLLLKLLITAKGAIVPFADIENHIWADEPVSNSTLRTLVYRIRSKLEYKIIETIPSFGCRLTPLL